MKVGQVIVVGPNLENLGVSFEIVSPMFKGFDDGKEFFIVNVIV